MSNSRWAAFVAHDLSGRDFVIDVFRGLAVIGMILVNHPIPLRPTFTPLAHAPWHGLTLADTIYPAFLFIVGVALALTTGSRANPTRQLPGGFHVRVARRVVLLFALSVLIINFPSYGLSTLSVTGGVLAQIGLCYLILAYLAALTGWRVQVALVLGVLLAEWALYAWLPVPGVGAGAMSPEGNAQRYIEETIFGSFAQRLKTSDNSFAGVVFTMATVATGLTGLLAGTWLRCVKAPKARAAGLLAAGALLVLLGSLWGLALPINKQLGTPSFVVLTSGISLLLLSTLYWVIDARGWRAWAKLPHVAGVNALVFFVLAWSLQRIVGHGRFTAADGSSVMFRHYLRDHWPAGQVGSLIFSLLYLGACFAVIGWFYRRRWFFKL
jgi:predicted acyltransferase